MARPQRVQKVVISCREGTRTHQFVKRIGGFYAQLLIKRIYCYNEVIFKLDKDLFK